MSEQLEKSLPVFDGSCFWTKSLCNSTSKTVMSPNLMNRSYASNVHVLLDVKGRAYFTRKNGLQGYKFFCVRVNVKSFVSEG